MEIPGSSQDSVGRRPYPGALTGFAPEGWMYTAATHYLPPLHDSLHLNDYLSDTDIADALI
jgi:hypothetical protein